MKSSILALVLLSAFSALPAALAQAYYVDFAAGSDSADGRSQATAWKRAPGDPSAGGAAAATTLLPGDSVLLKGGVVYEGNIIVRQSGDAIRPITFKGDAWGSGKALLEGSAPYRPTWTRCATAAECLGNPNFAQIYYATAPAGYTNFRTALYENGDFLWYAQGPNPKDFFYFDEIGDFYVVPDNSTTIFQTQTSITDPRVFSQTSSTYWNNAYVAVWINGNVVQSKKVTGYNPATATVTHEQLGNTPYTDRDGRYCLLNHLSLIDKPGEYVYDAASNRIYLWPRNSVAPAGNQYSVYSRDIAIFATSPVSHVIVEGFRIERFTMAIKFENGGSTNIVVRNNDVRTLRSGDWYAIHMAGRDSLVEGNSIVDANRAVGILSGNENVTIRNNRVERASRQGIWFMGASNSRIENNTVTDIKGSHANGISIYSGSSNIVVSGNRVTNTNSPITFEQSQNLTFTNNVVVGTSSYTNINDWGGCTGVITFHNNTCPNSTFGLFSTGATYVMRNNVVLNAPSSATRSHNIFLQSGATLKTAEFIETDQTRLFVAPASGDYRLISGSRAIDAGTAVPVDNDIAGTSRPQGAAWDIGAFEFATVNPPSNVRYVRAGAIGNGTGSDWTNAITQLPATLTRGYTYYIADGSYGSYTFDDAVSGTQVITLKKQPWLIMERVPDGFPPTATAWRHSRGNFGLQRPIG
jgi:parallel beta-helix repeat protein